MIIDIPDKGMKIEFPDDMDMKEVERQIMVNVYDQDVISEAPEKSLLEKGKEAVTDFGKNIFKKAIDPWTVSEDEEAFRPDNPLDIDILNRATEIKPDQPPEKTILSYAPYMAVKAVKGAMGPLLSPLKTLGMDSEGVLNTAAEYWQKRLPDVGVPNAGIVFDKNGDLDIQRIDDMPLSEIVGATSEGAGFLAPASVALKGAGLITEKFRAYARPFYRSILKGMIGGGLLGEGKKDETLESMAMFGLFEGAGFAIGEIPGAIKGIKKSRIKAEKQADRMVSIKERGLVVQDLEQIIKNNPDIKVADLVKESEVLFKQAVERSRGGIEPKTEVKPIIEDVPKDFTIGKDIKEATSDLPIQQESIPEIIQSYKQSLESGAIVESLKSGEISSEEVLQIAAETSGHAPNVADEIVTVVQTVAIEKAVSATPGPERQIHLDNLIAINAKIAETKRIAEEVEKGLKEEEAAVADGVEEGEFIPPEIAIKHPDIIDPKSIIEKPGKKISLTEPEKIKGQPTKKEAQDAKKIETEAKAKAGILVHTMPDGSVMKGPIHEDAVPGSERTIEEPELIAIETNKALPGTDIKYDGEQDRTIAVDDLSVEAVKKSLDDISVPDKKVKVSKQKQPHEMDTTELVQYVKSQYPGEDAQSSYGRFVTFRNLKPEINMKEYRGIFESVGANNFKSISEEDFKPTHTDKNGRKVQVTFNDGGTKTLLFEDGSTGSHPLDKNLTEGFKFADSYSEIGRVKPDKVDIPLSMINPTVGHTKENTINKREPKNKDQPIRVSIDHRGNINIEDGNHRYFAAVERGDKRIEVVFNTQLNLAEKGYVEKFLPKILKDANKSIAKKEKVVRESSATERKTEYKDWFVNYTEQPGTGRTTDIKHFSSLKKSKAFAKGKHGYITRASDGASDFNAKEKGSTEVVEYFGEFEPSAQEEQNIKNLTSEKKPTKPTDLETKVSKEEEIKVTGKKDKTVKVEIPKAEADSLKPKEQKAYLIKEIDAAIETALEGSTFIPFNKDVPVKESFAENVKKYGTVTIKVPGDGEFKVLNNKIALRQFKKRISRFPASQIIKPSKAGLLKGTPGTKRLNKRIRQFAGEYSNPYVPRKSTKLIEAHPDKKHAGFYGEGFYAPGQYMVKMEKPKTKRPIDPAPDAIKDLINVDQKNLYKAEIGNETYTNPSGLKSDGTLNVKVSTDQMPKQKGWISKGKYNPEILDVIFKHHPGAEPYLNKDAGLYFLKDGETVAVVMPLLDKFANPVKDNMDLAKLGSSDRISQIRIRFPQMSASEQLKLSRRIKEESTGTVGGDIKGEKVFKSILPETPKPQQSVSPKTKPQERSKPKKPLITEDQKKATAKKKKVKEAQLKIESAQEAKEAVHSMVRQRRFNLNLSSYETNKFINDIEKVTTRQQREVLPFIIEKTDVPKELNRPDLEKTHGENKEHLADIAGQVKKHFDRSWKKYKKSIGDMTAVEIENYVTHIWEIPRSRKQEVSNWFTTKNRFAKQRFIETLEKGIKELGLKPKVLDIGEIIRIHDAATNKAIENKKLVDDLIKLKKDGVPLIERIDKAPQDWVIINHPALAKSVFIPGESKIGEKITPELENILYEMGVAIGRRINSKVFGKPNKVGGLYKTGDPPEVRFQRFMSNKTIAHEIGHHIDSVLDLGESFLNKHKTELYELNKDRIEKSGLEKDYTTKASEQIAEAFVFLFTDPKLMTKLAPTVMTDMLARLKEDGVLSKLVDFDFEKKAKNLIEEQLNTLTRLPVRVHPDLVRPLKVVFESNDSSEIMQAYDSIAGILKKTSLSLSLFHHLALGETGIATTGPGKVAGIYFNPAKIYKALVKGEFDVFKKEAIAKDAIGHGLQMGATSDIPVQKIQGYLNDFAAKTKNTAVVGKVTEFMRTFNEKWDTALWDYLHDTLKLYAYESLTVQYVDPTKNVKSQKEEVAQFVNDTFGGQNWDVLMVTPKEVQIMTRVLLSADWTVSTMRQALAPTGIGTIHKKINKPLRRKMGRMFWIKAGLYFGVGINMLNVTFRKADRKENPKYYKDRGDGVIEDSMYGNALGHKSHLFVGRYEDGTERYIRWGKQFRELMEMFVDDSGFSPVSASVKKIGGKANPLLQLTAQITTGHSLSGFRNDDISGKKGWDFTAGVFKTLLKSPLPFSSRTLMTPNKEFHITDIAMPSSKGMSRYKAMSLFKIAIIKKDERFLKEVYQDTLENNLPAYTLFNAALTSLKAEESTEYSKTLKDLNDLKKLKPVKNRKEALILKRKIRRLVKEEGEKLAGIKLLDVAIAKSKIYMIEKGEKK